MDREPSDRRSGVLSRSGSIEASGKLSRNGSMIERMTAVDHEMTEKLIEYLRIMVTSVLDCNMSDFEHVVRQNKWYGTVARFSTDLQSPVLLIAKHSDAEKDGKLLLEFRLDVNYKTAATASLALIKRVARWSPDQAISSQLLFLNFAGNSPYETAHAYLHNAISPYLSSVFAQARRANEKEKDNKLAPVKRHLADLELMLLNLQQDTEIPEIILRVHHRIEERVKEAERTGEIITSESFQRTDEERRRENFNGFLKELHHNVTDWESEVQKITNHERLVQITSLDQIGREKQEVNIRSATREINFWINLERVLDELKERRMKELGIITTIDILKRNSQVTATIGIQNIDDTIKRKLDIARDFNAAMQDLPLNDLIAATTMHQIVAAIPDFFEKFNSNLQSIRSNYKKTNYKVMHAYSLVASVSQAVTDQMFKILEDYPLLKIDYKEFQALIKQCKLAFKEWGDSLRTFQTVNKPETHLPRPKIAHANLEKRLELLAKVRKQHEDIRKAIESVLADSTSGQQAEGIDQAYRRLLMVEVLDLSEEGSKAFALAQEEYARRVDHVETAIAVKFREQLTVAQTSQEMFRIFSKYTALFFRPRIRGAIQEYQIPLLKRVKDDIGGLQNTFKIEYENTQAARMSALRDIKPKAGRILWYKQIERQLNTCNQRVSDVLGEGWEQHKDGKKLKEDIDNLRNRVNTKKMYQEWLDASLQLKFNMTDRIFLVHEVKGSCPTQYQLMVNYDPELVAVFKEARNMKSLDFNVPYQLARNTRAEDIYPYTMSLEESIRTYMQAVAMIDETLEPLLGNRLTAMHKAIKDGCEVSWSNHSISKYVRSFSSGVYDFYEKVDEIQGMNSKVLGLVDDLATCELNETSLRAILTKIQGLIENLSFKSDAKMIDWVQNIDTQIEERLSVRLREALLAWTDSFNHTTATEHADTAPTKALMKNVQSLPVLKHELRVSNQVMHLSPPIESARRNLLSQLHDKLGVICRLPRIKEPRFETSSTYKSIGIADVDYRGLLLRLHRDGSSLQGAYSKIDQRLQRATEYVNTWYNYQALWDMDLESVNTQLGDDLTKWYQLLVEIQQARRTFDNAFTSESFGNVLIDYGKVQANVNTKYDSWHKTFLHKYGGMLSDKMIELNDTFQRERSMLEYMTIDTVSTEKAVEFITVVQDLKRKQGSWSEMVALAQVGEKLLQRQRFAFPNTWLWYSQLADEWEAFSSILTRKDNLIQAETMALRRKVTAEEASVAERIDALLVEWDQSKPIQGDIPPEVISTTLEFFDDKFTQSEAEYMQLCRAFGALEIAFNKNDRLDVAIDELNRLKKTWAALSDVWTEVYKLQDMPWNTVAPRNLRKSVDELLSKMSDMNASIRQYAAYDGLRQTLRAYLKSNSLIVELKSEALRDRHWRELQRKLNVKWSMADLKLGEVWGVDLLVNEPVVREVLTIAQGEMGLEEFLRMVKDTWNGFEIELVNYQNKTRLAKGWDDIFGKLKEQLSSLHAMRLSPYFKVFADEANSWEERLNRMHAMLDVWVDVQRTWVYLYGIFSGSADIQNLLPQESNRFNNISTEFLQFMRRVAKNPLILEVMSIPSVQKLLERLGELLNKVQHALGEYLERERSAFPRFYFVGDEDLLEVIGNGRDVSKIQKSFKKMFTGIHSVVLADSGNAILGMVSKEGETIAFLNPINLSSTPRINEWLGEVESQMRIALAALLAQALVDMDTMDATEFALPIFLQWLDHFPAQLVVIALQVTWTRQVGQCIQKDGDIADVIQGLEAKLEGLASTILIPQPPIRRRKIENLITELVHKREVTRSLMVAGVSSTTSFDWLSQMRFYHDATQPPLKQLVIRIADANFHYGFEYLGVVDKLVQTPLTDRMYLTMTQALKNRLGGSPFGPAGTGKTESVKALGTQLGRFVLVFNCDDKFDFQAMGRIFVGLCQVGAWGCFDEFNRLEERILSAVSQQIQHIQLSLRDSRQGESIETSLMGKPVKINPDMAIFVTMNPGYAGRSNLPDNLKALFRPLAMTIPDRQLIAQVLLFSQGFRSAELLARKIVPLFELCGEQLSAQPHYDFGLRSLKSVLVSAGNVKRDLLSRLKRDADVEGREVVEATLAGQLDEQVVIIQSICETMVPKLVADDIPLLFSLLQDVFPGVEHAPAPLEALRCAISKECEERHLVESELFVEKVLQLYQIQFIHHGVMMVGSSGTTKSTAWQVLLAAMERVDGQEGMCYVIDPKAISKAALYGTLDHTTREWTDGLFTGTLRRIVDNVRNELSKRHWIVFDGDVDPEWVENLNSVLDDNMILTLPNGERLALPPNVKIMFEVENLKYATPATVSRCGMVWFSNDILTPDMLCERYVNRLRNQPLPTDELDMFEGDATTLMAYQDACASLLENYFKPNDGFVLECLKQAEAMEHVMEFTWLRVLNSLFSMMDKGVRNILKYNVRNEDLPMDAETMENYITKYLVYAIVWCFAGSASLESRHHLGEFIKSLTTIPMPLDSNRSIIDYEVNIQNGEWQMWATKVPTIEVETHKVGAPDVVIPTIDTVRHEELLYTWLADHKPVVLCGPPGSGKTMTLFSALRSLTDMEVVGINFSSATTPELLLKTFDRYCEYKRTSTGTVLSPIQPGKWLVLFCDEINLPDADTYGTQRVIAFLRQIVEHGGFWRSKDHTWVTLERVQFVGACNPPTDPGRKPLTTRFTRHVPVVLVDYPGEESLKQIYRTFNRALLRLFPHLRSYAENLTDAMVDLYSQSQKQFTVDDQPHYVYSPRELTRWVRGIYNAVKHLDSLSVEMLVRTWAHEALRLFQDRLLTDLERGWTDKLVDNIAKKWFNDCNYSVALERPILYSNWISKDYVSVEQGALRSFVKARLKDFYEEELDVALVLFNEVLDHVLRIDRVFRQPQGHLLLIGVSGSGKTTLTRFVAWMNGLKIFQVKAHSKYGMEEFDEDLRSVLRRAGVQGEKMCFILDEGNVLDSGFLERINTLLANGEVPGLFDGDEYTVLMTQCKDAAQASGKLIDSNEELYKWFCNEVMQNLHVVFTMNPTTTGLKDRAATSPALFNRCVVDWFGDWSIHALYQVGLEFTNKVDIDNVDFVAPSDLTAIVQELPDNPTQREVIVNTLVGIHKSVSRKCARMAKLEGRTMVVTPRHFLDFINHYVSLFVEKRSELEDQKLHLNIGLRKIDETVVQVEELREQLSIKQRELTAANDRANEKLKQMLYDQQEAEKKREVSVAMQAELAIKEKIVFDQTVSVENELAEVEPAVSEARDAVSGIKKNQLSEVRSLQNPPAMVKLAMESVCTLLGELTVDWKAVRQVIVRDDFITSIVNFNTDHITRNLKLKMERIYLSNPDFTFENANRASKACGPLVKWVIAQLKYSDMLLRIEPLRNELRELTESAINTRNKAYETETLVVNLEASIQQYKNEYAGLIAEAESLKANMATVETKVFRSEALLHSLSAEQERWNAESMSFEEQMSTIVGDTLLSAAFIVYAGYFDQLSRQDLLNVWQQSLYSSGVDFRDGIALAEYLSTADERLEWQACGLPVDDLCSENAIMLHRFKRYPLTIDPSGQAASFLTKLNQDKKMTVTSFLDTAFRKNLESALRFGNTLLVHDAENFDPIINPVLNRELYRAGGRILIKIGDQEIDFSPSFSIILCTRNPAVNFPPDICSRVTFVNFTITRASLQSQCLNAILKSERPDVDKKRIDLLRLQGDFRRSLRHLEKALLESLNSSKGKILDDDSVITTLESLKHEAADIKEKFNETDVVTAEVEYVRGQYEPLAAASSAVYFSMGQLTHIHFLYQFSLDFFLDIFDSVLHHNPKLTSLRNHKERLNVIDRDLFLTTYKRVSAALHQRDRFMFALLLAMIKLDGSGDDISASEYGHFMRGPQASSTVSDSGVLSEEHNTTQLPDNVIECLETLQTAIPGPAFRDLFTHVSQHADQWEMFLNSPVPEQNVPVCWNTDIELSAARAEFYKLLVVQAARSDRILSAVEGFVNFVFGTSLVTTSDIDLASMVEQEVKPGQPILLCSVPGYDAANYVEEIAVGKNMRSIAIGSAEGYVAAEQAILAAARAGQWILLKNVHLAPEWMEQLEKTKLHTLQPTKGFRLFMSMEINPKIAVNLLRMSRVVVLEPPPGIRASLLQTLHGIPAERMDRKPAERSRVYFLLAWLHAIIQERLRYAPVGWAKKYEFSESDLRVGLSTIDSWIDNITGASSNPSNVPPERIPWVALRALLSQCIYGGRVDNDFDRHLLDAFLNHLFVPQSFDIDYELVRESTQSAGHGSVVMPDSRNKAGFLQWVEQWTGEGTNSPQLIGLHANEDATLHASLAKCMRTNLLTVNGALGMGVGVGIDIDVDVDVTDEGDAVIRASATQHACRSTAKRWLSILPVEIMELQRNSKNIKDPIFRCFEREVAGGAQLLRRVRGDLQLVIGVCSGDKQSNVGRVLLHSLITATIPKTWMTYDVPMSLPLQDWMTDFCDRMKQLQHISTGISRGIHNQEIWLGGLMYPEAYITATRQAIAQGNHWSLEDLSLQIDLDVMNDARDSAGFVIVGLFIDGAKPDRRDGLSLDTRGSMERLHRNRLRWVRTDIGTDGFASHSLDLPLYLNHTRQTMLSTATVHCTLSKVQVYQRAVALFASVVGRP